MNPVTNFEKWINSIATGEAPGILPVTRLEHFLNKIRMSIARKNDIKKEIPVVESADKGKYLHANESTGDLEWAEGGSSLPEYDSDDIGKSLSVVDSGETEVVTETVTVIESQTPNSAGGGEYILALGTYDLSEIEVGDTVDVTINGTEKECEVYAGYGDRKDIRYYTDETHFVTITEGGSVWDEGTNIDISTAIISATREVETTVPVPAVEWAVNSNIAIITATLFHGDFVVEESYSDMMAIVEGGKIPVLLLAGLQLAIPQHLPQDGEPNFEWACSYFSPGNPWNVATIVVTLNDSGCYTDYAEYSIAPVDEGK